MIGILLLNLGTPDAPKTREVRRYLRQFLSDPRVIDIHPIARWLLLNLIILPLRSPKSAALYQKIWTPEGSPLLVHSQALAQGVGKSLGGEYAVELGMRYGQPSIEGAIKNLIRKNVSEIRVLPLFPQYAASSTGSAIAEVYRVAKQEWDPPPLKILPPFFDQDGFVDGFKEIGRPILERVRPDHVLFSFHGLPERHIRKSDATETCLVAEDCCPSVNRPCRVEEKDVKSRYCYRFQCFATAHAIAKKLNLNEQDYTVCFQSRLGRTPWIKPYTDLVIPDLVKAGKKRLVVFCPSFVADCLETLEEIGLRANHSAKEAGAEVLELVPSLNAHSFWIQTVCERVK